jgi:hypothetical protein
MEFATAQTAGSGIEVSLATLDEFFAYERKDMRLDVLATEMTTNFVSKKRELLLKLRERDVFILERGAIEAYYPPGIDTGDKPTRAQKFCNTVTTREALLACCAIVAQPDGTECSELEMIFRQIFLNVTG